MAISPRRQRKYARVEAGNRRRTEIRRARRQKRNAKKPGRTENNFTAQDHRDIEYSRRVMQQLGALPENSRPVHLFGLSASLVKFKSFLLREAPRIDARSKFTPDTVIDYYRNTREFQDVEMHLQAIQRETPLITREVIYGRIKEIWKPKEKS